MHYDANFRLIHYCTLNCAKLTENTVYIEANYGLWKTEVKRDYTRKSFRNLSES